MLDFLECLVTRRAFWQKKEERRIEGQGKRNLFLETFEHLDPAMLEVHPSTLLWNSLSPSFGLSLFDSSIL